ncbi:MAG TPA: VCBS repeat-containing protein [Clostridia bacterium]|nr:VCBS repeat-containing protein [Clostridia bacterium]
MKRRIVAFVLLVFLSVQFSGCSLQFVSIDKLMHPPKLYGDNTELQDAFEKAVGADVTLKSPNSGNYKSAFIFYDIDSDGDDEVFVFYVKNSDKSVVRMQVMDKKDNEWVAVSEFVGSGSEVHSIEFVDLNGDGISEVLVSWNILEKKGNRILTVYRFDVNDYIIAASAICTENFTVMKTVDIDSDSYKEIFLILLDLTSEVPQSVARVLKMTDNKITLSGETKLDGNVSGYSSINTVVSQTDNILKLYIDAYKGESQMITEVVFWNQDTGVLEAPLIDEQTQSNIVTWRSTHIPTYDINGDGEIEIPAQTEMPGGVAKQVFSDKDKPFYVTKWYKLKGKELIEVEQNAVNYDCKYIFDFSAQFKDYIAIYSGVQGKEWKVFLYNKSDAKLGSLLFTISCVDKGVWNKSAQEDYYGFNLLFENDEYDTAIAASITQAGKDYGLNFNKLDNLITIFDEG